MGLLSEGRPLNWAEAETKADFVRSHGIEQFINLYNKNKDRQGDDLKWGDEIEYMIVEFDHEKKRANLVLRAGKILEVLKEYQTAHPQECGGVLWHPEFARYMLEATPLHPYQHNIADLLKVECNMKARRELIEQILPSNQRLLSLSSFPRLGLTDSFPKDREYSNNFTQSKYFPDEAINPHPRFATLVQNIRTRRGCKVIINVPVFKDTATIDPILELDKEAMFPSASDEGASRPWNVYMDCMGFGMGCCCLQTTFQAFSIGEARKIYDQLVPLAPIMMALTAATPLLKGYLVDTDCRWDVISASVDDRTDAEKSTISKSRYGSVSRFIFNGSRLRPEYNDLELIYNEHVLHQLMDAGVDETLAKHFAHLYIRDPLVIYEELLEQDNHNSTDHFENIQSTNWQSLRFKPPPPNSDIGWRVEFRSMEVQPNDFENAAFSIFIVLLARTILFFDLNLYLPLSKVDINMDRSHEKNAVLDQKFFFRTNIISEDAANIEELSANQIINGSDHFEGLLELVRRYLKTLDVERSVLEGLERYMDLISKRASGEVPTPANIIRSYILSHPLYQNDSKISEDLSYHLLKHFKTF